MVYVGLEESTLFVKLRILVSIASPRGLGVVVVVGPFGEMVGEFLPGYVGG